MDQAAKKKPSRWEVLLGWLMMLEKSPQEHTIDYLEQVEARLQRLERSLQPERRSE